MNSLLEYEFPDSRLIDIGLKARWGSSPCNLTSNLVAPLTDKYSYKISKVAVKSCDPQRFSRVDSTETQKSMEL